MSSFVVEGGHRLSGTIRPQGAKNEHCRSSALFSLQGGGDDIQCSGDSGYKEPYPAS